MDEERKRRPLYGGRYPGWIGDESSGFPEEELHKDGTTQEPVLKNVCRERRKLTEAQREILQNA